MADKMTVLFAKQTGHALAVVTRSAAPESELQSEALARDGLPVRGLPAFNQPFTVAAQQLKALVVNYDESVILNPRGYRVDEGQKTTTPLSTSAFALGPLTLNQVPTGTEVRVSLSAVPTADVPVWIQVEGGDLLEPRVTQGVIPKNQPTNAFAPFLVEKLTPGLSFRLLTLVSGLPVDARNLVA
jgi:hypothetical protein